jgi:hypothetical protein
LDEQSKSDELKIKEPLVREVEYISAKDIIREISSRVSGGIMSPAKGRKCKSKFGSAR